MADRSLASFAGPRLTRRRLVLAGAAGATGAWLGGWRGLEQLAHAAGGGAPAPLRRSTYLSLSTPDFRAAVQGGSAPLTLVAVEDLPAAASVPSLAGHEEAFAVRFRGDGSLTFAPGPQKLSHPDLGTFDFFVAPVERRTSGQDYEAIVDRTIRLPGLDGDGAPQPVAAGARGQVEESASTTSAAGTRRVARPRLLRASLRRAASGRRVLARLQLGDAGDVRTVRALLMRGGRVVAKARADGRRNPVLRFAPRRMARRGRYDLVLTVVDREGRVTRLRRSLRLR